MAICKKCGAELKDDEKICSQCGEPYVEQSDNQQEIQNDCTTDNNGTDPAETAQSASEPKDELQASIINIGTDNSDESNQCPTQPAKKLPRITKKAAIILASCFAFLLICGFTAKTYFARDLKQLFLGQNKYMQSVEKDASNVITNQTVMAFDSVIQAYSMSGNGIAADYQNNIHIDLDTNFTNQLQQLGGDQESLNKIIDYINSTTFKGSTNLNGEKMQASISMADKTTNLLTLNMFLDNDGKFIYQLPDLSKTYLILDNASTIHNPAMTASRLKYDTVKLKASLHALSKAYLDAIPNGKISIQKGQGLTLEGITVTNAEKISVTLSADQITQILKQMAEIAKNDDYLYTFFSENYNTLTENSSEKMDKTQYEKLVNNYFDQLMSAKTLQELTVSAYVLPNNTQVARSYEITKLELGTPVKEALNLISTKQGKLPQIAATITENDKENFSAKIVYNAADSGVMQIDVKDPVQNSSAGLKAEFTNIKKATFSNKEAVLGTFKLSLTDPNDLIENELAYDLKLNYQVAKNLVQSTMTVTNTMENDKLNSKCSLNFKGYANIQINSKATPQKSSAITIPSIQKGEALEMGSSENNETQIELQQKYARDSLNYLSSLLDKDEEFADFMLTFGIKKENIDYYLQLMQ